MRLFETFGILALVTLPFAAHAEGDDLCADASSQVEINQCYSKALADAEGAMQTAYDNAMAANRAEEPALAAMLEIAQPGWRAYRDQQCALENYYSREGSGYAIFVIGCKLKMTEERSAYLTQMVEAP